MSKMFLCSEFTQTVVGEVCATIRERTFFEEREDRSSDLLKDFVAFCGGRNDMQLDVHIRLERQQVSHAQNA